MNIEKDEYNVIPFADMFNHSSNVEVRLYQAEIIDPVSTGTNFGKHPDLILFFGPKAFIVYLLCYSLAERSDQTPEPTNCSLTPHISKGIR